MGRLLVHVVTGPENPTRAALGLLVAKTALAAGHGVDVFLAADAVDWLRPETAAAGAGVGTGSVAEHLAALLVGGATIHASGMSAKARGIGPDAAGDVAVAFGPPDVLVRLTFEADRVLCY
jgi:predicted peroxiredoxin